MRFPYAMAAASLPGQLERDRFATFIASQRNSTKLSDLPKIAAGASKAVRNPMSGRTAK